MGKLTFIAYNGRESSADTLSQKIADKYAGYTTGDTYGDFLKTYCTGFDESNYENFENYLGGDIMCYFYDDSNEKKYVTFAPGYGTTGWPCECYNNRLSMVCKYIDNNVPYLFVSGANVNNYDYLKYIDRISLSHDSLIMNVNYEDGQRSLYDVINYPQFFSNDYTAEISFHYDCETGNTDYNTGSYYYTNTINSPFTEIPERMFYSNDKLKQISIPKTVTDIGASAFTNCDILEYFGPKRNISGYSEYCFANCTALTELDFTEYHDDDPYVNADINIGEGAFSGCSSLKDVNFSLGEKNIFFNIGNSAFTNCYNIDSVDFYHVLLDKDDLSKGDSMFAGCSGLTRIYDSNTGSSHGKAIPDNCFKNCKSISGFNNHITVSSIGENAFANAFSTNVSGITIPTYNEGVAVKFGSYFLSGNTGLEKVTIEYGSNVTSVIISNNCFCGINSLTNISFTGSSLYFKREIGIGNYAFSGLQQLSGMTLGYSYSGNTYNFSGASIFSGCNETISASVGTNTIINNVSSDSFSDLGNNGEIIFKFSDSGNYDTSLGAFNITPNGWKYVGDATAQTITITKNQ